MDELLQQAFNALLPLTDSIGNIVIGIAGIATLFYIGSKVWENLSRNEPIDIYPLLRPFVVAILIFNFSTLVITPAHYILAPVRKSTAYLAIEMKKNNEVMLNTQKEIAKQQKEREAAANKQSFLKKLERTFDNIMEWIKQGILSGVIWLLSSIRDLLILGYKILRIIFLTILGTAGPLAFALSVFPSLGSSLTTWLSKYIGIYIWLPIANILDVILVKIESIVMSAVLVQGDKTTTGLMVLLIFMYLIGIFAYMAIPAISGWIVSHGDIGGAMRGMSSAGRSAGAAAGGAAGAAAGTGLGKIRNALGKGKSGK